MYVHSKVIRSSHRTWQTLLAEASSFASNIEPRLLINISHSCSGSDAVVVVWYWDKGKPLALVRRESRT